MNVEDNAAASTLNAILASPKLGGQKRNSPDTTSNSPDINRNVHNM